MKLVSVETLIARMHKNGATEHDILAAAKVHARVLRLPEGTNTTTTQLKLSAAGHDALDQASYIPQDWVSMTEATEALWGTSGRGSPNAVRAIEALAAKGLVEVKQTGKRSRIVRRAPTVKAK